MSGFRDLLAWLLGWKSRPGGVTGPYRVEARAVFTGGRVAGEVFSTGILAGEVYAY
jgi:hypothetical protein